MARVNRCIVRLVVPPLLTVAIAACGSDAGRNGPDSGSEGSDPVSGGSLTYLQQMNVTGFDPAAPSSSSTTPGSVLSSVFGMLLYDDYETGEVVPWMAESMTPTDAGHWVLRLRDGIEFTDGTPFDAEAVAFNWQRIQGLDTNSQQPVADQIGSLDVVDPLTLDIELTAPNSEFDRVVARGLTFVGSPAALRTDEGAFVRSSPVGAGPFVVTSVEADGTIELDRNPSYWDQPRPYLDHVRIRTVPDNQQRLDTFVSGGGDLVDVSPQADVLAAGEAAGFDPAEIRRPGGGLSTIFNTRRAPFHQPSARLAFQHAIDREALAEAFGRVEVNPSLVDEDSEHYSPSARFPEHDPDTAQRLFDEYADRTGEPMHIALTGPQTTARLAELLQAQLAEYDNVSVELDLVDTAQYVASLSSGAFDAAFFNINFGHPLTDLQEFFETGGGRAYGGYSSPEVDRLLEQAAAAVDGVEQARLLARVQDVLTEEAVAYTVFTPVNYSFVTDRVHDLDHAVDGIWLLDRIWVDG